jgi:hypothetical protein
MLYIEQFTRNNRRIFWRRVNGKLVRASWWDIRDEINSGKPVAIKRDLTHRSKT